MLQLGSNTANAKLEFNDEASLLIISLKGKLASARIEKYYFLFTSLFSLTLSVGKYYVCIIIFM